MWSIWAYWSALIVSNNVYLESKIIIVPILEANMYVVYVTK